MKGQDQLGLGWTVVLRRQPVRIVAGRAEGGYTDVYELVCWECGDDPDLDYGEVPPELPAGAASATTRPSRSGPRWRCWACSPARSAARR